MSIFYKVTGLHNIFSEIKDYKPTWKNNFKNINQNAIIFLEAKADEDLGILFQNGTQWIYAQNQIYSITIPTNFILSDISDINSEIADTEIKVGDKLLDIIKKLNSKSNIIDKSTGLLKPDLLGLPSAAQTNPKVGNIYVDTVDGVIKYWDGKNWKDTSKTSEIIEAMEELIKEYVGDNEDIPTGGGARISSVSLSLDPSTYKILATITDDNGETYTSNEIDLPLETMVINGSFDNQTLKIILTLKNGSEISFGVNELIKGLYSKPDGGIPLTDLSSSIQNSLGKADTALQSLTGYATESWVGGQGYLTEHQDISGKSNTTHTHTVKINGSIKTIAASNGTAVDLGTYLTEHQDISGKADKSSTVSTVSYDANSKKITKTINGKTSDVVSISTLKSAMDAVTTTDLNNAINALDYSAAGGDKMYIKTISQTDGKISATAATLDKSAVGLDKVDNTPDVEKNVEGANHILSLGNQTMITGTTKPTKTGISLVQAYNNGYTVSYGNVINVNGAGSGQILCEWTGGGGDTGHLYYRSLRDTTDGWTGWKKVAFTTDNVASATTATSATKLQTASIPSAFYEKNDKDVVIDTHLMCLGYMSCTTNFDSLTLLIDSAFYGNQHGSQDIITILSDLNPDNKIQCTVGRVHLGGTFIRTFYYYPDSTNKKLYLYVYVTGGNSYGNWQISYLGGNAGWATSGVKNVSKTSSWVEISYSGIIKKAAQLQTTRTIWGKSFDGTGNVNGNLLASVNDTSSVSLTAQNSNGAVQLLAATNRGLYDSTNSTWIIATNGTNTFLSNGNVGIGTTAPEYKLDVIGEIRSKVTTGAARLRANYNGTNEIRMYADSAIVGMWGQNDAPMVFATNNNERMRLTSDGKLGIGTTAPQQKLHVSGTARTQYVDFYSKDAQTTRAGWVGRGSGENDNLTLYSDKALINIDSNAEINLKAVHKQAVKIGHNATALQSYTVIGEASTNCNVANLNFSVNGYESLARLQFLKDGNFYIGRNYETTIGNDNAAVRIPMSGALVLSSTAALSGTRDNAIYIRPAGSNSTTNQAKFESGGVTISASSANSFVIKRTTGSAGAFVNYYNNNQSSKAWRVGMNSLNSFVYAYSTDGLSSNTDLLTIDTSGNVGIGTTSPSEKLDVDTATSGGFVQIKKNSNAGADCGFAVSNTTYALELMIGSGNVNRGLYDRTNKGWWIYRDATTNTLIPAGNVGIGTASPAYKCHVVGGSVYSDTAIRTANNKPFASQLANGTDINLLAINTSNKINVGNASYLIDVNGSTITLYNSSNQKVTVTGGNMTVTGTVTSSAFYQQSDDQLKTYKRNFDISLEQLLEIPLKYFEYNDQPGIQHIGTSAQEVEKIIPEIVSTDDNGFKSVDYSKLSIAALKAVHDLNDKYVALEQRLEKMEKIIEVLTNGNVNNNRNSN